MKFKRLYAEMILRGISKKDLAKLLNKSERVIRNRLNGVSEFTYDEMMLIAATYFNNCGHMVQKVFFSEV
ncbi:MAG: helix-turn-helix transcriptional regulator [Clostridiaceae bacterium]